METKIALVIIGLVFTVIVVGASASKSVANTPEFSGISGAQHGR